MTTTDKGEEAAEAAPATQRKLPLLVILSILSGMLLILSIGVTVYHFQSGKKLKAELAATRGELKEKTQLAAELQEQVASLSRQMHALRDFSVNRAYEAADKASPAMPESAPLPVVAEAKETKPVGSEPTLKKNKPAVLAHELPAAPLAKDRPAPVEAEAVKPKPAETIAEKKSPPPALDCQLAGKSAEARAATLQRCVQGVESKNGRR